MPSAVLFPLDWHSIDHVVLDFGGVLYEIDHHKTADAFAQLGLNDFYLEFRHGNQAEVFDRLERGEISEEAFLDQMARRCHPGTTVEQVRSAWNALLMGLRPEALPWVHSLVRHFDVLLFSNTNAIHAAHFEQDILNSKGRSFGDSFRQIIYSHRLGQRKPEVHTYEQVAREFNLQPERTVLIDDTKANVAGAIAAGWQGVYFDIEAFNFTQFIRGVGYDDFLSGT